MQHETGIRLHHHRGPVRADVSSGRALTRTRPVRVALAGGPGGPDRRTPAIAGRSAFPQLFKTKYTGTSGKQEPKAPSAESDGSTLPRGRTLSTSASGFEDAFPMLDIDTPRPPRPRSRPPASPADRTGPA